MFIKVGDRIINTDQIKSIETHLMMSHYIEGKTVVKDTVRILFNDSGYEDCINHYDFIDAEAEAMRDYVTTSLFDVDVMKYHTDRIVQRRKLDALKAGLCPDCGNDLTEQGECNSCGYSKWA